MKVFNPSSAGAYKSPALEELNNLDSTTYNAGELTDVTKLMDCQTNRLVISWPSLPAGRINLHSELVRKRLEVAF